MNEQWKPIEGTDGTYEVSNTGKIRSNNYLGHGSQKELSLTSDQKGYLRVRIYMGGSRKTVKVHREVARAFLPNPENKSEVNHKDGNKKNNHVENLEWSTARENTLHAYKTGLKEKTRDHCAQMGRTIGRHNLAKSIEDKKTPVIATRLSDGAVFEYPSQTEAAAELGTFQANIYQVLTGKRKSAKGYVFSYKEVVPNATDDY